MLLSIQAFLFLLQKIVTYKFNSEIYVLAFSSHIQIWTFSLMHVGMRLAHVEHWVLMSKTTLVLHRHQVYVGMPGLHEYH
jgi:hypothetical protein